MRSLLVALAVALLVPVGAQAATNPVVAAAKRTATITSSTFQLSATTASPGQTKTTITGGGAQRGTSVKMAMRTRSSRGGGTITANIDAIMLNESGATVMYMRSPAFGQSLPAGKSWLRVDLSKEGAGLGVDFSSLLNSSYAPLEKGLVSTTRLGRETVAGASTMHYRAVVDVKRAARAVPAYGKQVAAIEKTTGVRFGRTPYDVWVGGDGRIKRMRFSTPSVTNGVRGTTRQTITFLSVNRPVSITAPPAAQVFSP